MKNILTPKSILGLQLCNAVSLSTNQFAQSDVVGRLDQVTNPNAAVITCKLYLASGSMQPGEQVKLIDRGASDSIGLPIVGIRAADADGIFGTIIYDPKTSDYVDGDRIQVAIMGGIINQEAGAAVLRGALVASVTATPGTIVTRTTEEIYGITLDKATASGQIVRVLITARGFAELALYELST